MSSSLARSSAPDAGRVDDGEAPRLQAQVEDRGDQVERLGRRPLVVLVFGDEATADVGGHDLGRLEMALGEGRLAGARRADQQHEREFGDRDPHRVNTASWLGAPNSACSSPRPSKPHGVAVPRRHVLGPAPEFQPGPLEAVVGVPQPAGLKIGEQRVVVAVRRGHHDQPGPRVAEQGALEMHAGDRAPDARRPRPGPPRRTRAGACRDR